MSSTRDTEQYGLVNASTIADGTIQAETPEREFAPSTELSSEPLPPKADTDSEPDEDENSLVPTVWLDGDEEELPLGAGSSGDLHLTPNPLVLPGQTHEHAESGPATEVPPPAIPSGKEVEPAAGDTGNNGGGKPPVPPVTHAQEAGEPAPPPTEAPMTLLEHLGELRRRLTRIVILVILGFFACYGISEPLYAWLSAPLKAVLPEGSKLIYTSPQGAFFVYMKVALVASLFLTSPFSFYQIWAFIAPGLYKEEKRAITPLAFFSAFFFITGASFCYYLVFPVAFQFFMGFATDVIVPMISVEEYLSFVLKLIIAFGLVFEMPLFAYFLARMGLLTPEMMRRQRKYAVLLIFVVAAVLTPPDVFSQTLMACPMLILYEVSIYVAKIARKGRETRKNEEESEEAKASETSENSANSEAKPEKNDENEEKNKSTEGAAQ